MSLRHLAAPAIGILAASLCATPPAAAAAPGPAPHVIIGDLNGPTTGPDGEPEWMLTIDAVDPDGAIWEVMTRWSDGEISFANTFCLQGTELGTPAHLLIPHSFTGPGRYRVQVQVTSVSTCAFDPDRTEQTSRPYTKILTVTG